MSHAAGNSTPDPQEPNRHDPENKQHQDEQQQYSQPGSEQSQGWPAYNQQYPGGQYGQQTQEKKTNILGIIGLALGAIGFILACIPGVIFFVWILLLAAFVLGIISLFQKVKFKWMGIVSIALAVIGTLVGVIILVALIGHAVGEEEQSASSSSSSSSKAVNATAHYGDKQTWDDGLSVTATKPTKFKPSEDAFVEGGTPVKMTVTIHNGKDQTILSQQVHLKARSGSSNALPIVDDQQHLSNYIPSDIHPGQDLVLNLGYEVENASDVSFEFKAYSAEMDTYQVKYTN
ncbi:DUF308 domain-containing protein [Kocuria massiliensis]|uniref:DUF308 domain-containing protein n=1 Tax=Kocuria massiliensis TaxID=1926282 RepID=UPI000A1CB3EC|nr:DUF308 domain-containing protein [Kocuria massiliensis]